MKTLFIGLAFAVAAPGVKETPKKDPNPIVGVWNVVSGVAGGMKLPVEEFSGSFTFGHDGTLVVKEQDVKVESKEQGAYKVDIKASPFEIDLIPPPAKKDVTIQGIFKIDGDNLVLCFSRDPKAGGRPKIFDSPAGSMTIVITLKKAK